MGDQVSVYNGALTFQHTDVSLPGNSALPVAVGRVHSPGRNVRIDGQLADWDLDIPRISGIFASSTGWINSAGDTNRCSAYTRPAPVLVSSGTYFQAFDYWQGNHLYVPGVGTQEVLTLSTADSSVPGDGHEWTLSTTKHWRLRCLSSIQNGAGQGFVARSPDGIEYRFDWMASRVQPHLSAPNGAILPRVEIWLMPTEVKDRHGNTVTYTYDPSAPWRLLRIEASDGRVLDLTWVGTVSSPRLRTVSDGTRTWTYGYDSDTFNTFLKSVSLPDGSQWLFNLNPMVHWNTFELGEGAACNTSGSWPEGTKIGTITHPSGAVGTFELQYIGHPRAKVLQWCVELPNSNFDRIPRLPVSQTLVKKSISGPGLETLAWTYSYASSIASWSTCTTCPTTKTVEVTDPEGDVTRHTFGIHYQVNEGHLLQLDEGWNGSSALRTTTYSYREPSGAPYPEPAGASIIVTGDHFASRHRPEESRVITQQGASFTRQTSGFDFRARPTTVQRSSTLGYSRTDTTAYYDNDALWVIGQVASVTESSTGLVAEQNTYGTSAMLTSRRLFGRLDESRTYYPDGNLATRSDGAGKTTTFADYMRGLPQTATYADGSITRATVNLLGQVTSMTDENGYTTGYGYDALGRLNLITPPAGDTVAWNPTTLEFAQVGNLEYGLEAGHWRQTIATGNARKVTYFDALWRPVLTRQYDTTNETGTRSMVLRRFDSDGREAFQSYVRQSITSVTGSYAGVSTNFDALGREAQRLADSELGVLTTTTAYMAGFQRRVTDPRGNVTTTTWQAFDEPAETAISTITAPEGANLSIVRDVFGKARSITRSGSYGGASLAVTRSYVYDPQQRLCKTVEPEAGATILSYDSANNIEWRAAGQALTGLTACSRGNVAAAARTTFAYDARNRLESTYYGDGSPGISRTFTPDGLPRTITSDGSTWTLSYNHLRKLTAEVLSHESVSYIVRWGYDANGSTTRLVYPDGAAVAYVPDALGRPTQVGSWASSVTHHPNGSIAGYNLANGVAHTVTLNGRNLPRTWVDSGVNDELYAYDGNANVVSITDRLLGTASRTLGYDGLDRLSSAAAPSMWGSATFAYDPLDNLRTSTVGTRNTIHGYDAANRLTLLQTNGVGTALTYDVRGNLATRGSQGFSFDQANRMGSAPGLATYRYDGLGRRVSISGADGSLRIQVYSQAGQLLWGTRRVGSGPATATRYVYLGERLIAESSTAGIQYVHTDALGSPVARTGASGQVITRTRYEPYGATASGAVPGVGTGSIGFTGHVHDPETALVYMQQRYYDPLAGRFLSVDPVTTNAKDGSFFARYHYANNNPYRFKDPDGEAPQSAGRPDGPGGSSIGGIAPQVGPTTGAGAARGQAPMQRGIQSEARVLKDIGQSKNTQAVEAGGKRAIPDFQNSRQVGEIKDSKRVSDTAQIRTERSAAQQSGREHVVVTGTNTQVSSTVQTSSTVIRRDDLGPQVSK